MTSIVEFLATPSPLRQKTQNAPKRMKMKKDITTFVSFSLLLLCSACVSSKTKTPGETFEMIDYGIITGEIVTKRELPSNPAFTYSESSNTKVEKQTTIIPARLGTRFGFFYMIHGEPKGRLVPIDLVYHVPGLRNPKDGKVHTLIKHSERRKAGTETYAAFIFMKERDLVPGTYLIQIVYQGSVVLEKTFTIVQQ